MMKDYKIMNLLYNLKKGVVVVITILIVISSFATNVYAESNNEQFKFEQSTYSLRGEGDSTPINLILPSGYTLNDVEISSENENIVHILNFFDKYYMESLDIGETRLKAIIKSTDYVAYCDVKVEEPIIISVLKKNVGVTLEIDNYCPWWWSIDSKQACEISVTPINYKGEEKWIRLGEGIYSHALNKKYSYDVSQNCIISVRWISWWNGIYYDGEHEIYRKTIIIDDLEPTASIGANIKIYANNSNESSSTINIGDTLQLNTEIVEIPNDTPITWKSYQENVAIVDTNGTVTALRDGIARIEATATVTTTDDNIITYTDVYPVIVQGNTVFTIQQLLETNGAVHGMIPDKVTVGSSEQALVFGDGIGVSWSSSNDEVATINKDGLVQGITSGNVIIEASVTYNNRTYNVAQEVEVTDTKEVENNSKSNESNNTDTTVSKKILPNAGKSGMILLIGFIFVSAIIAYKKTHID